MLELQSLSWHSQFNYSEFECNCPNAVLNSKRIKENFEFFKEKIQPLDPEKIYAGIRKLMIVDIALDSNRDNPQLIFESLNSTGLELSQADLIRNFFLMGLAPKHQDELYCNYWQIMEKDFVQAAESNLFDRFMRDYLTIKTGTIPNIKNVYETFKNYCSKNNEKTIDSIVEDMHKYSQYFLRIALEKEEDKELRKAFSDLNELKVDVAYPLLLTIYSDFKEGIINKETFLSILIFIQSYVFRRFICDIPTNSLNKTFTNLYKSIDKENYLESLKAAFLWMPTYKMFPSDSEFVKKLTERDLYNTRNRNFWLRRFENYNKKERIEVENYTIEHIMPQNENLSSDWKAMLGDNWQEVHNNYLHTLGNLTLTGYNSELSDKSFPQKKTMKGGFDTSPLTLNESVREVSIWNEAAIKARAKTLAETMTKIWPYPTLSPEVLEQYNPQKKHKDTTIYTLQDHPFLTEDPMQALFEIVRKRILNIDASVKEIFLKKYVTYKADTNFVDIEPQKKQLCLYLNIDYAAIHDPNNLCIDVTGKGHWRNGDVRVNVSSTDQLDNVFALIKQAFEKNLES